MTKQRPSLIHIKLLAWLFAILNISVSVSAQQYDASVIYDHYFEGLRPSEIAFIDGKIYFSGDEGYEIGEEPWISDGSSSGTHRLKNIAASGAYSSYPEKFTKVGSNVFFFAASEEHGKELWITDGTEAGTRMVKDIRPGPNGIFSSVYHERIIVEFRGKALFLADDGLHGLELWLSDGTSGGTYMIKDIDDRPEEDASFGDDFFVWNNICYFQGAGSNSDEELWRTDGTAAGTYELKDLRDNTAGQPERFMVMGGHLYFRGRGDDTSSWELWRTDGTAGGTVMVKDVSQRAQSRIQWMTVMGNHIYFTADELNTTGRELWKSDGTSAGTVLVKDIRTGRNSSSPEFLTVVGNTLYFVADNGQNGSQLWKTNGTAGGTVEVFSSPLFYGSDDTDPKDLVEFDGKLFFKMQYFNSSGSPVGYEWFYLSGSQPVLVRDISAGTRPGVSHYDSAVREFVSTPNALYFPGDDYYNYRNNELWRISRKLSITNQPDPLVIRAGTSKTLSFSADQALTSVQWYHNNAPIPGANSSTLSLDSVTPEDAGYYRASCSSATGSATTATVQVAILESETKSVGVKEGGNLELSVEAHGDGLSYIWKRDGINLSDDSRRSGSRTDTLNISNVVSGDAGVYVCQVQLPGASRNSYNQTVRFVTLPVVSNTPPPAAVVSGPVNWQLGASQSPSGFKVSGLPKGLTYDRETGLITGKTSKAGTYRVRVTAQNVVGNSEVREFFLTVEPMPDTAVGNFWGEIDRHPLITNDLGGSMKATIKRSGALSGTLNLGGRKVRFRGRVDSQTDGDSTALIEIPETRKSSAVTLQFNFNETDQVMTGSIATAGSTATFRAYRNIWHSKKMPADLYTGRFNVGLDLESGRHGDVGTPQGHGYFKALVNSSGRVKISGRAGDGAKFSTGVIVSRTGRIPFYAAMHRNHASFLGNLKTRAYGDAPDYVDSLIEGALTWRKRVNTKKPGRSYPNGFATANVNLRSGKWFAPVKGDIIIDLPDSPDNAYFAFSRGGLSYTEQDVTVKTNHKVFIDRTDNPNRLSIKINPKTGTYSGRFYQYDPHPLKPGATLRRTAKFSGILSSRQNTGYGYFSIPDLPTVDQPRPDVLTGYAVLTGN